MQLLLKGSQELNEIRSLKVPHCGPATSLGTGVPGNRRWTPYPASNPSRSRALWQGHGNPPAPPPPRLTLGQEGHERVQELAAVLGFQLNH